MNQDTKDQFWSHLNILLLVLLFCVTGAFLMHVYHHAPDHASFVEQMVGQILAAILALLTASRIRNGDKANGNGGNGDAPKAP